MIGAKNGSDTFASAGTQKSGKSIDFTLFDVEIKWLDTRITIKSFCLKYDLIRIFATVWLLLAADIGHIIQFFTKHLGNQFHTRQIFDLILTYQFAVTQYRDLVTDLIYLIQKVGYKDNAYASGSQIPHQGKEFFYFLLIQRGCRLI